jgi:hypothetical protein
VARHRFNGVAMTGLAFTCIPWEARYGIDTRVRPCESVAGGGRTLRVRYRGFCCRRLQRAASVYRRALSRVTFSAFYQSVDAGSVKGLPFTAPTLAASEFLDGARVPFGAFRAGRTFAG